MRTSENGVAAEVLPPDADGTLAARIVPAVAVTFARELRNAGVLVSTSETIDAARAVLEVGFADRAALVTALRATLAKDVVNAATVDRLADRILPEVRTQHQPNLHGGDQSCGRGAEGADSEQDSADLADRMLDALHAHDSAAVTAAANDAIDEWSGIGTDDLRSARHHTARTLRGMGLDALLRQLQAASAGMSELDRGVTASMATAQVRALSELVEQLVAQRLAAQAEAPTVRHPDMIDDLPILSAQGEDLAALRNAVRPLARKLASRLSRRRRGRGSLDMRRTVRSGMGSGGVLLEPQLHRRRRGRPQLVVLCDASGSVAQFVPFTLALLHALDAEFDQVRSWVFIDGAVEVTGLLHSAPGLIDVRALLGHRGLIGGDGRSDYAAALQTFLSQSRTALSPRTTTLIVGDARSHGRPAATEQLRELRRSSRRVFWFNPEPKASWNTQDSRAEQYGDQVDAMYAVSTLRQLGAAIEAIA